MKMFNQQDKNNYIEKYNERLEAYGYNPKTLGWGGGIKRQKLRFKELMCISEYIEEPVSSVLDIGCGFADMYQFLRGNHPNITYRGLDINPKLLNMAHEIHGLDLQLDCIDILDENVDLPQYDIVLESGIFNAQLQGQDQIQYIDSMLRRMFSLSRLGMAADFMTTYVDWKAEGAFYMDPAILIKMAKNISQRVIIRHDYLPYEFCVYIFP